MLTVEWEPAAECYMLDFHFETAPPGHETIHMALGHEELLKVYKAIEKALQKQSWSKRET